MRSYWVTFFCKKDPHFYQIVFPNLHLCKLSYLNPFCKLLCLITPYPELHNSLTQIVNCECKLGGCFFSHYYSYSVKDEGRKRGGEEDLEDDALSRFWR